MPSVSTVLMSEWTAGTLLYIHTVMQLSNDQWQVWNCILVYNIVGLIWTLPFVLLDARVSTLSISAWNQLCLEKDLTLCQACGIL